MEDGIHIGFEIGTGEELKIPIRHMVITGQSQEAGKTTTLEALATRADMPVLAFVTKRFEKSFQGNPDSRTFADINRLRPYLRQRADWQFVASILEATLHERMKFQRSWIMKLCQKTAHWKAPKTLYDVRENVMVALESAKGLNESVYTELKAYLDLVVPEIERLPLAAESAPELQKGLNVMDLSAHSSQMQQLVIQSTLDWVYQTQSHTLTVIPEAWEFVPQKRGSPVKLAAEQLIRKGAAGKNYIWLDSQDLANVDKDILRQATVWILGVQRERNETRRTLEHIYADVKPTVGDIMGLELGQFIVCFGKTMKKVYVTPRGIPQGLAWSVATGKESVFVIKDRLAAKTRAPEPSFDITDIAMKIGYEESMWKEKYEEAQKEIAELKETVRKLERAKPQSAPAPKALPSALTSAEVSIQVDAMYSYIRDRARKDPELLNLLVTKPSIVVKVQRPTIDLDDTSLRGRIAGLIAEGYFNDEPKNGNTVFNELRNRRKFSTAKPNVYRELDVLAKMGFLTFEGNGFVATGLSVRKAS